MSLFGVHASLDELGPAAEDADAVRLLHSLVGCLEGFLELQRLLFGEHGWGFQDAAGDTSLAEEPAGELVHGGRNAQGVLDLLNARDAAQRSRALDLGDVQDVLPSDGDAVVKDVLDLTVTTALDLHFGGIKNDKRCGQSSIAT